NYTPEKKLETQHIQLKEGEQVVEVHFEQALDQQQYGFICLMKNETVSIRTSKKRVSGLVTAYNKVNKAVSNFGRQEPPEDIGIDAFEFWCPNRRPDGNNLAFTIAPAIRAFSASNLNNGYTRPNKTVDGCVGDWNEEFSRVIRQLDESQTISNITLMFDTDFDHAMESTLRGHPERVMPFCVRSYRILDNNGEVIYEKEDNYQTI